jgi:hypothetical protein
MRLVSLFQQDAKPAVSREDVHDMRRGQDGSRRACRNENARTEKSRNPVAIVFAMIDEGDCVIANVAVYRGKDRFGNRADSNDFISSHCCDYRRTCFSEYADGRSSRAIYRNRFTFDSTVATAGATSELLSVAVGTKKLSVGVMTIVPGP